MANDKKIKVDLTADVTGFRKAINGATKQVEGFGKDLNRSLTTFGGRNFTLLTTGFAATGAAATAAAVGGLYLFTRAIGAAIGKASEFSTANFGMRSSIEAANRQFDVGSAAGWEDTIKDLQQTLRIFSETDLRNASARTIDMTKRLGLSAEQMKKVIQVSADLSSGKTNLVDGVERVTAALRGEAEASEYLGLTLNEDYVKGWHAANNATGKAWKDLTDLEKAQVRYNILLEQASPSFGRAAASADIYSGALQEMGTNYGDLQKEVGGLFTQNTFVIESFKVLSGIFKGLKEQIAGNRGAMVNLVKDGFVALVSAIGTSIEVLRFFYNGWQGLGLVAHGVVTLMVKGFELTAKTLRVTLLRPLDLLLTGMEKIGAIDSNPLKNFEETLSGFGEFSADEFNSLLDGISDTNRQFDEAKSVIDDFKKKISEIPAEYKDTTEQMSGDTKEVSQEMELIDGVWVNVFKTAKQESKKATDSIISDINRIKSAAKSVSPVSYTRSRPDGFATGGDPFYGGLPGYGGGDRRIIAVEDGEHVIRKEGTAKLGHGFFQRFNDLNFLRSLPGFKIGGPITSGTGASVGSSSTSEETVTVNFAFPGNATQPRGRFTRQDAKILLGLMEEMHRGSSR
jgi:hypothetical protein